ncbi:MAG: hypothetical protein M1355_02540 [Patescibacteria group bacterium]|nr:hypothetical protein [Patescibacteria group bacterium]
MKSKGKIIQIDLNLPLENKIERVLLYLTRIKPLSDDLIKYSGRLLSEETIPRVEGYFGIISLKTTTFDGLADGIMVFKRELIDYSRASIFRKKVDKFFAMRIKPPLSTAFKN